MTCPNCGLANAAEAKFCANCGTPLAGASYQQPQAYQPYQQEQRYGQQPIGSTPANPLFKNVAVGCLIVIAIFIFMGLSCTRACLSLGHRRVYVPGRRY